MEEGRRLRRRLTRRSLAASGSEDSAGRRSLGRASPRQQDAILEQPTSTTRVDPLLRPRRLRQSSFWPATSAPTMMPKSHHRRMMRLNPELARCPE